MQAIDIRNGAGDADDPRERELAAMRGEKVADDIKDDPRFSMVKADPVTGVEASNGMGSFESLMAGWGSPARAMFDTTVAKAD